MITARGRLGEGIMRIFNKLERERTQNRISPLLIARFLKGN